MIQSTDRLKEADHRRVAVFVDQHAGIQLPAQKRNLIETRLRKRQRALGFDSLTDYIDFALDLNQNEHVLLIDALTTNKTEFFRERDHFDVLVEYVRHQIPRTITREKPLDCWSAGCSSGQEPYTIAMVLRHMLLEDFLIWATDISVSVLERARKAVYPHREADAISLDYRKKYLLRSKDKPSDLIKMSSDIRRHVQFSEFNLVSGNFRSLRPFDVIFCRNVMIYFDSRQRHKIIRQFHSVLRPGGLLFIGHSETITADLFGFRQLVPTVYVKQ